MAKSITHAAVGIAGRRRSARRSTRRRRCRRGEAPPKEAITLQHLLEMRSGLRVRRGLRRRLGQPLPRDAVRRRQGRHGRVRRRPAAGARAGRRVELLERHHQHRRPASSATRSAAVARPAWRRSCTSGCSGRPACTQRDPEVRRGRHVRRLVVRVRDGPRLRPVRSSSTATTAWSTTAPGAAGRMARPRTHASISLDDESGFDYGASGGCGPQFAGSARPATATRASTPSSLPDRDLVVVHLGKSPIESRDRSSTSRSRASSRRRPLTAS